MKISSTSKCSKITTSDVISSPSGNCPYFGIEPTLRVSNNRGAALPTSDPQESDGGDGKKDPLLARQ